MFIMFAPVGVFAEQYCTWDVPSNTYVNYTDSPGTCSADGILLDPGGETITSDFVGPPASSGSGLSGGASDVSALVSFLGAALNVATRLILGAAVVFFLWGVFQFVQSAGDEEARKIGKDHIIYGVIGIAIMVSVWGLVNFVTGSIGLDTTKVQSVPKLLDMPV